ncbi:Tryptophan synthase alpha chain [Enhygromyxa salina]|uniref:Tryptophan synthase alpha chain n=1 Tax=Enhygromyxa salina TaxID=215803 RepID=A0A0C2CYA9_9BACT|nr:Tryptophan synthase alpha chain [Enhygromyxa salina]
MQPGRIAAAFERCRGQGRAALVGYLTGFDPDHERGLASLIAACEAGVDVLELGVPFSDPTADGPEIQSAMVRALAAGATLEGVLALASAVRSRFAELPIVLFSYANPLLRACSRDAAGARGFCQRLRDLGVDALLVVDLPPEQASILRAPARAANLDWIGLCAPTSPPARLDKIVEAASGFVYAVSLTGVTGSALDANSHSLRSQLEDLRGRTQLPIAVGFGVREPSQVRALAPQVDGVVVGSALVKAGRSGPDPLASLVADLRAATSKG